VLKNELPKTIPAVRMLLALEEMGSTILFLLKKWISRASRLAVRSFAVLLPVINTRV
jgi:hypothetical protein